MSLWGNRGITNGVAEKTPRNMGELFQLESADLDFGLYRLLHLKRQEVEAFLMEQLPRRAGEAFQGLAGEERSGND